MALLVYDYFLTLQDEVSGFPSTSPDGVLTLWPRSDMCGEDRNHGVSLTQFLILKTSPDGLSFPTVPLCEYGKWRRGRVVFLSECRTVTLPCYLGFGLSWVCPPGLRGLVRC